jgi:transposase, IS30 family
MNRYHQLTREQRYQLEALLANDCRRSVAAAVLRVDASTVSRELRRNGSIVDGQHTYRAKEAQRRTDQRRIAKGAASRKIRGELRELVETKLRLGWSPEQICGRLRRERDVRLSHETIYQHVIRDARQQGTLRYALRHGGYGYHRLRKTRYVRLPRSPRRSIVERPPHVEQRRQIGHWERDLVLAKRPGPAILVMNERATRYTVLRWLDAITLSAVADATATALEPFNVASITNDNGSEFNSPEALETRLNAPIYFCAPGAPWQRGTVENTGGLLRQYFPKRESFSSADRWLAPAMQHCLNTRPRKCLGYRTPHEALFHQKLTLFSRHFMHFGLEISASS